MTPQEGIHIQRKARSTGTEVCLSFHYWPNPEWPWQTYCINHGCSDVFATKAEALRWLSHPYEWCDGCRV